MRPPKSAYCPPLRTLRSVPFQGLTLMLNCRGEKQQERGEAQGAADGVQHGPTLQELLGELGVFVQGGVEEALVGGEDDDQGEG
jgi:hypothetical protein